MFDLIMENLNLIIGIILLVGFAALGILVKKTKNTVDDKVLEIMKSKKQEIAKFMEKTIMAMRADDAEKVKGDEEK